MPQFNMTDQEAAIVADYIGMVLQSPLSNPRIPDAKPFTPEKAGARQAALRSQIPVPVLPHHRFDRRIRRTESEQCRELAHAGVDRSLAAQSAGAGAGHHRAAARLHRGRDQGTTPTSSLFARRRRKTPANAAPRREEGNELWANERCARLLPHSSGLVGCGKRAAPAQRTRCRRTTSSRIGTTLSESFR